MKNALGKFTVVILSLSLIVLFQLPSYGQEDISWQMEEFLDGYSDAFFNAEYKQAIDIIEGAIDLVENKFGKINPNVAALLNNLGALYKIERKYPEAESAYGKALDIYEQTLGFDNSYTAGVYMALGEIYQIRRKYKDAEDSFINAQKIMEKNFGSDSPNSSSALSDLGSLYKDRRKYAEAEAALTQALQTMSEGLGEGHPVLIKTLYNLGLLYEAEGKQQEAEQAYKYMWDIFKGNFTPEQPGIEGTMNKFESERDKLWSQKNEPIYKRVMDLNNIYIGPWHPDAPLILDKLPSFYVGQDRYAEAELYYEDIADLMFSNLGQEHPNIAKMLDNMSKFYKKMGNDDKARELKEKAQEVRTKKRF